MQDIAEGDRREPAEVEEKTDVDDTVKELVLISAAAVLGLGLAWRVEADYFAMFFAASAAIAIMQAVRRSL